MFSHYILLNSDSGGAGKGRNPRRPIG